MLVTRGPLFHLGAKPIPLESAWHTEEEWLVDSIARDIGEMALFASSGRVDAEAVTVRVSPVGKAGTVPLRVSVRGTPSGQGEREIALSTFVWSPEEYEGLSRDLFARLLTATPNSGTAREEDLALSALTDLRASVIEETNERVSRALAERFLDPGPHEAAALVLSSLALREAAGTYADIRGLLCRVTAHLAVAGSLRRGERPGLEGRVARAALLILAGRGADGEAALDDLDREANPGPASRAWRRALRLRLTDDYRVSTDPASLLERRELYRALLWTGENHKPILLHGAAFDLDPTDQWRLGAERKLSVEGGNELLRDALEREVAEIKRVRQIASKEPLGDKELVAILNAPAGRCITPKGPRVIAWGIWAEYLQRHLIQCLWMRDHHVRSMLGLPREADDELHQSEARFGGLTLYPLLETRLSMEASQRPKRLDEAITLIAKRPELYPAGHWWALCEAGPYEVIRRGAPNYREFFSPGLPRGTTFELAARDQASLVGEDRASAESILAISPKAFEVLTRFGRSRLGPKASLAEFEAMFGERSKYDSRVLEYLWHKSGSDPVAYRHLVERQCALVPDHCFEHGGNLVEIGDFPKAAAAYQRGIDLASDSVGASVESRWLVNYYLDVGEREKAEAVADWAASIGSNGGLISQSRYLERTGDFDGAEGVLRQARQRYGNQRQNPEELLEALDGAQDQDQLIGFFYRMAFVRKQPGYEERFRELLGQDFPNGLEVLQPQTFSGRPSDGVLVLKTWARAEWLGIKTGDIIVGLDGFRVRSRRQYYIVRGLSDNPEMHLFVFRHPSFLEVKLRSAKRELSLEMRSVKPTRVG